MKREELIKKLTEIRYNFVERARGYQSHDDIIADFILAREKEQISKVVEPLRSLRRKIFHNTKARQDIDKSLSIADSILRGEV